MPSNSNNKLGIAQLGLQGLQGLFGGMAGGAADKRAATNVAQDRDDQLFNQLLQSMANQGNVERDIANDNRVGAAGYANANPLGAEFTFRQNNALKRGGIEALGNRQLARGTPNIATGFLDRSGVRESMSDDSVNSAIQQRRIATAGIDPRAAKEIGGTNGYATGLYNELMAGQGTQRLTASQAYDMIANRQLQQQAAPAAAAEKEPGFWKKLGAIALPAAGLAANFIPGVGPLASMAIGAASGAAGGALAGGKKGALMGGMGGGGAAYGLNQLPSQQPAGRSFNNQLTSGPGSMRPVGPTAPMPLQSASNGGAGGGFMASIGAQGPPAPQAARSGAPAPRPQLPPMRPVASHGPTPAMPVAPAPRPEAGRFSDAKVGGYGAPMDLQASADFGDVAGPAMNAGPLGAILGGGAMAMGSPLLAGAGAATVPGVQRLLQSPAAQRLVGPAPRLVGSGSTVPQLGGRVPAALPAGRAPLGLPRGTYNMPAPGGGGLPASSIEEQIMAMITKGSTKMPSQAAEILAKMTPQQRIALLKAGVK